MIFFKNCCFITIILMVKKACMFEGSKHSVLLSLFWKLWVSKFEENKHQKDRCLYAFETKLSYLIMWEFEIEILCFIFLVVMLTHHIRWLFGYILSLRSRVVQRGINFYSIASIMSSLGHLLNQFRLYEAKVISKMMNLWWKWSRKLSIHGDFVNSRKSV